MDDKRQPDNAANDNGDTAKKSSKMITYPDISLKSANALVIACCVIFIALVVVFTIFR